VAASQKPARKIQATWLREFIKRLDDAGGKMARGEADRVVEECGGKARSLNGNARAMDYGGWYSCEGRGKDSYIHLTPQARALLSAEKNERSGGPLVDRPGPPETSPRPFLQGLIKPPAEPPAGTPECTKRSRGSLIGEEEQQERSGKSSLAGDTTSMEAWMCALKASTDDSFISLTNAHTMQVAASVGIGGCIDQEATHWRARMIYSSDEGLHLRTAVDELQAATERLQATERAAKQKLARAFNLQLGE
jgi:hypothetical protein